MKDPQNLASRANEVILELQRRRDLIERGESLSGQSTRLALVVEGGGMRGVVSGGVLIALEQLGLSEAFDRVYGESAGAINSCYFLARQAKFGCSIYGENLSTRKFVDPLRFGRILDVDYAIDEVVGNAKRLEYERVQSARSDLFISLTNTATGERRVVDVKTTDTPLLTLLKATAAIVPLYNRPVLIDGVPYADGGIADPIPVRNAIESGCTHILVLLTRGPDFEPQSFSKLERFVANRLLDGWNQEFIDAFYSRWKRSRYSQDLAFGRIEAPGNVKIGVICPTPHSPHVGRMTTNRKTLDAALEDSTRRTLDLF